MTSWSAVLRHLTLSRVPIVSGTIERGVKVHCSALLKHSLSSVSFREILECKSPLSSFTLVNFSSSPSKPTSDVHFLTSTDEENKCGEPDVVEEMPEVFPLEIQVKKITNTAGLMRNYLLKSIDVSVSRPSLVTGEEHENNMRIGEDEEEGDNSRLCQSGIPLTLNVSKQQRDSMEFCCASRKDDLASAGSFVRKNKKYGKKIDSYEGRGFWWWSPSPPPPLHSCSQLANQQPQVTAASNSPIHPSSRQIRPPWLWILPSQQPDPPQQPAPFLLLSTPYSHQKLSKQQAASSSFSFQPTIKWFLLITSFRRLLSCSYCPGI